MYKQGNGQQYYVLAEKVNCSIRKTNILKIINKTIPAEAKELSKKLSNTTMRKEFN